jgi:hypothetical protein
LGIVLKMDNFDCINIQNNYAQIMTGSGIWGKISITAVGE